MRRREFIALVGSTAVVWPLATRAQQPAMPLVGFLHVGSPAPMTPQVEGFRKGLAQTGLCRAAEPGDRIPVGGRSL